MHRFRFHYSTVFWHVTNHAGLIHREKVAHMGTVNFDFKGEVVLVTGGSRGLGLEIAHAFGYAGAQVVITSLSPPLRYPFLLSKHQA